MLLQTVNLNNWFLSAKVLSSPSLYGKKSFSTVQASNGAVIALGGYGDSNDSLNSVHAINLLAGSSVSLGTLLNARADFATAILSDGLSEQVFCFGGKRIYNFGQGRELLPSIELFDLNTKLSSLLEITIPVDLGVTGQFCTKLTEELLFIAGGVKLNGQGSDAIYIFDMPARRWLMQARKLPAPMGFGACTIHDGKVLMLGGANLLTGEISSSIVYWKPSNLITTL